MSQNGHKGGVLRQGLPTHPSLDLLPYLAPGIYYPNRLRGCKYHEPARPPFLPWPLRCAAAVGAAARADAR